MIRCLEALPRSEVLHRLLAGTPEDFPVVPRWMPNKFMRLERITRAMAEKRALSY